MKRSVWMIEAALLATCLAGTAVAETIADPQTYTGPIEDRKFICMSMGNALQAKGGIEEPYQGKTYYLCCKGCVAQFRNNPEAFRVAEDPVSHALVDKADAQVYAYKGRAYFFESDKTRQTFTKEPARYALGEEEGTKAQR